MEPKMEYERMGEDKSDAQKAGLKAVFTSFVEFLKKCKLGVLPLTLPKKEFGKKTLVPVEYKLTCTVETMQRYAAYLFSMLKEDENYKYSCGTALQYVSGAKNILELFFGFGCITVNDPEGVREFAKGNNADWYSQLRTDLERQYMVRCFDLGLLAKKKSHPAYEYERNKICTFLMSRCTEKSIEQRFEFLSTVQAAGRASEVADTQSDQIKTDSHFRCTKLDWAARKTGKVNEINIFAHRNNLRVCWVYSAACYFISIGYKVNAEKFAFPGLHDLKGKGKKLNKVFDEFYAESPDAKKITGGLTMKALRVGTTNEVGAKVGIAAAINRGNWHFEKMCTMFEYMIQCPETDRRSARTISGWHPDLGVYLCVLVCSYV